MQAPEHSASFAEKLLEAQELERARIAADLHDSIGQNLTTIKFNLELWLAKQSEQPNPSQDLEPVKHQCKKITEALDEIRHISRTLHPETLDSLGIVISLQSLCREYRVTHPTTLVIEQFDVDESQIPGLTKLHVYRICQEALANIAKHSNADQVTLRLYLTGQQLKLEIADKGIGIAVDRLPTSLWGGLGLRSIQQRTHQLNGHFRLYSEANNGTRMVIRFPLA